MPPAPNGPSPDEEKLQRPELSFAPNTKRASIIHQAIRYKGSSWGRNVVVYLISVAGTYGVMALVVLIFPPTQSKLPFLKDWAVEFAFWISLPAILFFVASDQDALDLAMSRVETGGVVTSTKDQAKVFTDLWEQRFRWINVAVQAVAVLLAVPLSYLTYLAYQTYLPRPGDTLAPTWAQAGAPNSYAYMWGIAVFYLVLIIYIGRGVAMAVLLKDVASDWKIKINPLHPDGCGGLRPLGRVGLRNQYALTILGINIAVVAATILNVHHSLPQIIIIPVVAIYVIFGPIIFLGPLLPFRRVMGDQRRSLMQEIAEPLNAKFDSLKIQARAHGDISKSELDAMDRLGVLGKAVSNLPVWPFDPRTMRLFATAYVTPVLVAAATKIADVVIEHAAN